MCGVSAVASIIAIYVSVNYCVPSRPAKLLTPRNECKQIKTEVGGSQEQC